VAKEKSMLLLTGTEDRDDWILPKTHIAAPSLTMLLERDQSAEERETRIGREIERRRTCEMFLHRRR
jgi:hypothetical protein